MHYVHTHTHATAGKFGGQCVNSCSGRSENIWASDMWVKLLSPSLLLFLFHPLFLNPLFLLLSSSNIIKPHVNIWSSDVIKWGWLCPELSDSPQAWGLAYRVIQSFVLLTCLPLRLFHLLSLIFWFGSVYLSSNLNMGPDQSVYSVPIRFAQDYEA